jgi:hypothetical protein
MALVPLLSYPVFMPKPSTHRMHDPGSIVQGPLALHSHWLLLKVVEVEFLKILKVVSA